MLIIFLTLTPQNLYPVLLSQGQATFSISASEHTLSVSPIPPVIYLYVHKNTIYPFLWYQSLIPDRRSSG